MISVEDARAQLFDLVAPVSVEHVDLTEAAGRVLAEPVTTLRDLPPFASSSMDGYALKSTEAERDAQFKVIGEAAAGRGFDGSIGPGQTVRIFTGAPLPDGADRVVIQEDVRRSGDVIAIAEDQDGPPNIRPAGADFSAGATLEGPKRLTPADIALLASMNIASVPVRRRPNIALISTGDELVMPGETPGPHQIVASNTFGLKAMLDAAGAQARILPIARDTENALRTAFDLVGDADLVITIGGASVGDYDLVGQVAQKMGLARSFYKVAMRPGKPLMAGRLNDAAMIGLPGNPVSALVCGQVFVVPVIAKMLGLGAHQPVSHSAILTEDLGKNGPREHYMRAEVTNDGIHAFQRQDSSLLTVLAQANALMIRPPHDPERRAGETVRYLPI